MKLKYVLISLVFVFVLSGCTVSQDANKGDFELLISDAPADIDDFDSLEVTFSEARVFNETNGFKTINIQGQTVDLTTVTGLKAKSIANTTLTKGNYSKIELYASETNGIVNGEQVNVKIPPGKLMINKNFEIRPNTTTEFVFDIQVVLRGNQNNNQGYILKPVISESGTAGKDIPPTQKPTE